MAATIAIDVCIATFKRPLVLDKLLNSLHRQNLAGISMRVIVVDNDHAQSARAVVDAFRARSRLDVVYDVEPEQNIALARNRTLRHLASDYFAFVDDDEMVSENWLRRLLDAMRQYRADIVFGPVISVFPAHSPSWVKVNFQRPRRPSGQEVHTGGAGNVLIKRSILENEQQVFDPSFGLTGGEDTDFFYRMHLAGRRLVWCDEAWAKEPVPVDRLSPEWLRRRGFRSGQNYARIFISRYAPYRLPLWFMTKSVQLLGAAVTLPLIRLYSYSHYVGLSVRMAAAFGQLSYCFSGKYYEEYRVRACS